MIYNGVKILEINPIVCLGKQYIRNDYKYNQDIFKKQIKGLKFPIDFSYECLNEDRISVYISHDDDFEPIPKEETLNRILHICVELMKIFTDVKINFFLDGYIDQNYNTIDLEYVEFIDFISNEIKSKLN